MISICSSEHLIIRHGMRKIDYLRAFDYSPWDEENVNLDEANLDNETSGIQLTLSRFTLRTDLESY